MGRRKKTQHRERHSAGFVAAEDDDLLDESDQIPYAEWLARLTSVTRIQLEQVARKTPPAEEQSELGSSPTLEQMRDLLVEVRDLLVIQRTVKDYYTPAEVATLLDKAEFTVREWCRRGRVRAVKQGSGRGKHQAWVISHEELQRLQREGLLPPR